MAFDADAFLDALRPPEFTHRGRMYRGRALSVEEWAPFEVPLQRAMKGELSDQEVHGLIRGILRAMFPRPRWAVWRPHVADLVLSLPNAARVEALRDFWEAQARATSGSPTPGSK